MNRENPDRKPGVPGTDDVEDEEKNVGNDLLKGKKISDEELDELLDNLEYLREKPFCCK